MTQALYRRYRPETFADVIGQEHVTVPLMHALRSGRVNHAYLFSGPRGCGKTTSARILARCLNCEQGPTDTPCGVCESCVALARGGSGSVDVIEIDAASHGGVDDARDLREKASYGPARSRYKIYIIDEAHMVTPQGFNALLKIVEEPPEHVKFVFATTEPEKVIGTIRSRTHHYPFRLVLPARLQEYLGEVCEREHVAVEPGVLPFVVRAGGGSVRDSLSVLDQLMAGADEGGLTYAGAAALLGFTKVELVDAAVDAVAAGDGASLFAQVDKVIESGQDPRRFVEDLLERLRDLIIVLAVGEGAGAVLRGVPDDQLERMRAQAQAFGAAGLSRAADVVNAGLTEMTGATSPRLHLELVCARLLLPGAAGEAGYAARIDRLERRVESGVVAAPGSPAGAGGADAASGGGRAAVRAAMSGARAAAPEASPQAPMQRAPQGADEPAQGAPVPAGAAVGRGGDVAPGAGRPAASAPGGARAVPPTAGGAPAPHVEAPAAPRPAHQPEPDAARAQVPGDPRPQAEADADADHRHPGAETGPDAGPADGARPATPDHPRAGSEAPAPRPVRDAYDQGAQHDTSHGTPARPEQGGPAAAPAPTAAAPQPGPRPPAPATAGPGAVTVDVIRDAWPSVLERISTIRRTTWTLLSTHAQVADFDGRTLTLGIGTPGIANTFRTNAMHGEYVKSAILDVLGVEVLVEGRPLSEVGASAPRPGGTRPDVPRQGEAPQHAPRPGGAPQHAPQGQHAEHTAPPVPAGRPDGPARPTPEQAQAATPGAPEDSAARAAARVAARVAAGGQGQRAGGVTGIPGEGVDVGAGARGWDASAAAPDWATGPADTTPTPEQAQAATPGAPVDSPPSAPAAQPQAPAQAAPAHATPPSRSEAPRPAPADVPPPDDDEPVDEESVPPDLRRMSAWERAQQRVAADAPAAPTGGHAVSDEGWSADDESVDTSADAGPGVISSVLGGTVIRDTRA